MPSQDLTIENEGNYPPFSQCNKQWPEEAVTWNDTAVDQSINKNSNFLFQEELERHQSKDRFRVSDLSFKVDGVTYLITYYDDVIGDGTISLNKGISIYDNKIVDVYEVKYLLLHTTCNYTYFNTLKSAEEFFHQMYIEDSERWSTTSP